MSSTPTPAEELIPESPTATAETPVAVAPMSPQECALQLKQRFPGLFGGAPKPLKLRIQADIQASAPGVFTKQALSAFLRRHTGGTGYLIALTRATHRFDLAGEPADELSEEHRQAARDELKRRREVTEQRRAEEDQQRHNRAQLLRDFEKTTLTEANFCALKGITAEELPQILALARQEATEAPPARDPRQDRRPGDRRPPAGPRGERGPRAAGARDGREGGGQRPPRAKN